MSGCVDQEELLVSLVCGIVDGAVFVCSGYGVDGEGTFYCDGGLGGMCRSVCAALELLYISISLARLDGGNIRGSRVRSSQNRWDR